MKLSGAVMDVGIGLGWILNEFYSVIKIERFQGFPITKTQWLQLAIFPIGWLIIRLRLKYTIAKRLELANVADGGMEKAIASMSALLVSTVGLALLNWLLVLSMLPLRRS
jgi:hypothetical protein